MIKKIGPWLDDRTGVRAAIRTWLDEPVRGGARWAYVFGTTLAALFVVEAITGVLLATTYAPSVHDAWSSVHYIQHRVTLGWFLRGLHANASQAMIVVLGLHLMQVVLYGAYKKPREVNWWLGLALFGVTMLLVLSGSRLQWDQRTFAALRVEMNITATMPLVGESLHQLIAGGWDLGQTVLTRMYAAHVLILPAAFVLLLLGHRLLVRRHGRTPPAGANADVVEPIYPRQLGRDLIFSVLVLGAVAAATTLMHGAPLDAPAEPSRDFPARPEWYLLALFGLREALPPDLEIVATAVIPTIGGLFLFALPFLDRKPTTRVRERLPFVGAIVAGLLGVAVMTLMTIQADAADEELQESIRVAEAHARRANMLARRGVPPGGPLEMLRNDPLTHGRDLYFKHCNSCHVLDAQGERKAPDHTGFASREWIDALLRQPMADHFFGKAEMDEEMPSQTRLGDERLAAVTELLYAQANERRDRDDVDAAKVRAGEAVMRSRCMECHVWRGEGDELGIGAPNLTLYPSRTWIRRQISHPDAPSQYGELNEMPSFADELDDHDMNMIAAFLRLQRYEQFRVTNPPPAERRPTDTEAGR